MDGSKPNIVFILTDDQGCWALGCAGNKEIHTPNLDRLAAQGVRFENYFCTSPVCSPARASLLTGRIPSQHGIHDWLRPDPDGDDVEYLAGMPGYTDILAAGGYTCGISGKWHMGDSARPQKSFSHWFVTQGGGGSYHNAPVIRHGQPTRCEGYLTDAITEDAIGFIRAHGASQSPFCLNVAYTAPHAPWLDQHPAEYLALYENATFADCPQEPRHPWIIKHPVEIQFSEKYAADSRKNVTVRDLLAGYYAAVTAMDAGVGRIMDTLEALGLRQNTLVCFMSDNGYNCGHHGLWGKGSCTFPLNMYDTSVKVPAIFSHPGRVRQGVVSSALLSGYDFMPTILEYAGLENPCAAALAGQSFVSILEGREDAGRDSVVVYDEYGPVRMVRTHEWKYVHRFPYGPHELYHLTEDPGERRNLLEEGQLFLRDPREVEQQLQQLKGSMDAWFARYVNPVLDGRAEPVCGRGQVAKAGAASQGRPAFHALKSEEYAK